MNCASNHVRRDGDKVVLSTAYEETLARPRVTAGGRRALPGAAHAVRSHMLVEHGEIGQKEIDAFESLYARVSRLHRSVMMKAAHARRRMAE